MATRRQVFLSYAFRPFFLFNGIFAVIVMGIWLMALRNPKGVPPSMMLWHGHEMLIGFAMAAVAGFLLTAVATWTGRAPLSGWRLGALVIAWLLGRLAMMPALRTPPGFEAIMDLLFPTLLCVFVAQEVIGGGSRRNYPLVAITALLATLDLTYHLGVTGVLAGADRFAVFMLLHLLLLLITIVGGRIVPNFTANWLKARGATQLPRSFPIIEWTVPVLTAITCLYATLDPLSPATAWLAATASVTHGIRLYFWRGLATRPEPLLLILHIAYAWLPIGYAITALAALGLWFSPPAALHALGMGAVGGMILAVTTRVALGHSGRALHAARLTVIAYLMLNLAVIVRVLGYFTDRYVLSLELAAMAWMIAFLLFLWVYVPILTGPSE